MKVFVVLFVIFSVEAVLFPENNKPVTRLPTKNEYTENVVSPYTMNKGPIREVFPIESIDGNIVMENNKKNPTLIYPDLRVYNENRKIYNFQALKFKKNQQEYYVLHMDRENSYHHISAYWVPQGRSTDIPLHPTSKQPNVVLTPPFSGCSMVIDYLDDNTLRIHHVEGGKENIQYNDLPADLHGYGMLAAITYKDYGYFQPRNENGKYENQYVDNTQGIMYMKYDPNERNWIVHYQNLMQDGTFSIPPTNGIRYDHNKRTNVIEIALPQGRAFVQEHRAKSITKELMRTVKTNFIQPGRVRARLHDAHEERKMNLMGCVTPRQKRNLNSNCHFSAEDLTNFVSKKIDKNHLEKIEIDSGSFLKFIKSNRDTKMNKQLLEFVNMNPKIKSNINGDHKAILEHVLKYGDIGDFFYEKRMNNLIGDVYNGNKVRRQKLVKPFSKYANRIMLMHSLYGVSKTCTESGSQCAIGVSAIAWSYGLRPTESLLIKKFAPKVGNNIIAASHFIKNVLPKTSQAMQLFAKTLSKTVFKVGFGIAGTAFDIYDVTIQVNVLVDCDKRKYTDDPCPDQVMRDSIAALAFDGVSIVAGVALISFPVVGLVVSLTIFAAQILYGGISEIIKYKRYNTDFNEDLEIFFAKISMEQAPIAKALDWRQQTLDMRAKYALEMLNNHLANTSVIAYGLGAGSFEIGGQPKPFDGDIHLHNSNDRYRRVSRVQPSPLKDVEMICLPRDTGDERFENGKLQSIDTATYYCHNAMVLRHTQRRGDSVILNLDLIDSGSIFGSNIWENKFLIYFSNERPLGRP